MKKIFATKEIGKKLIELDSNLDILIDKIPPLEVPLEQNYFLESFAR